MTILAWHFIFVDSGGQPAENGWPILLIITEGGEIRISIEDIHLLFYGVFEVYVGEDFGRQINVTIRVPRNDGTVEMVPFSSDGYSNDPEIVRLAGEFRDALDNNTFPERFKE